MISTTIVHILHSHDYNDSPDDLYSFTYTTTTTSPDASLNL